MFRIWYRIQRKWQMRRQAAAMKRNSLNRSGSRKSRFLSWVTRIPSSLLTSAKRTFQSLAEVLFGKRRKLRDLLFGLPAVILFLAVAVGTAMGSMKQSDSGLDYWQAGEVALSKGDSETAVIYIQKALTVGDANNRDMIFGLARAYEASSLFDRADVLMSSLAGTGAVGLPAAHRYLAVRTAAKVAETKNVESLDDWHWHLSHADQPKSAALQKSWGMYYLIGGDLENSIKHYMIAAEEEPAMWLQVAELQARQNDMEGVRVTLARARERLEQQFLRDPGNVENRLLYATSLFYIGELPSAELLLKDGLSKEDNSQFRQLLAAVFVRMYDSELVGEKGVESAFRFLKLALDYEPNFQPALTRLVKFARSSPERLEASREAMRQLIATGNTSAMAHFTLSTLEWIAGNRQLALLNMQQAIQLDSKLPVIANNMAYLMSQEEAPDLDAALNLVNQALDADPKNPDFRDTRGEIYMKRGELAKAAADYQSALETSKAPRPLQEKLADLYDRMGDSAMAKKFRDAASGVVQNPQSE